MRILATARLRCEVLDARCGGRDARRGCAQRPHGHGGSGKAGRIFVTLPFTCSPTLNLRCGSPLRRYEYAPTFPGGSPPSPPRAQRGFAFPSLGVGFVLQAARLLTSISLLSLEPLSARLHLRVCASPSRSNPTPAKHHRHPTTLLPHLPLIVSLLRSSVFLA